MSSKNLFLTGLLASFGVAITGFGEWLMLYSPHINYGPGAGYANFLHPSLAQVQLGFFIAVLSAPSYVLAYWHIAAMLKLKSFGRYVVMTGAIFAFMVGNVWLGTNAYLALIVQGSFDSGGNTAALMQILLLQIEALSVPLLQLMRVLALLLTFLLAFLIIKNQTNYPRWVIPFLPFCTMLYIVGFFLLAPTFGNYLLPAALSISHVLFLGLSTVLAYRLYKK